MSGIIRNLYNELRLTEVKAATTTVQDLQTLSAAFILVRCCYLLGGFQPKMLIRSTKRTFFNFLKGGFLYFFSLFFSTLTIVNNFVHKKVQLKCTGY